MLWRPKTTCDCAVEYNIDNSLPPDPAHGQLPVSSFHFVEKCPVHSSFSDSQLWDIIWDENPKYGFSEGLILDNSPTSLFDTDISSGARVPKPNVSIDRTYSGTAPNRVLNITIRGISLTNPQKNAIRNALNSRFGSGKAVLV